LHQGKDEDCKGRTRARCLTSSRWHIFVSRLHLHHPNTPDLDSFPFLSCILTNPSLRAWIDQPLSLLYFESRHQEDDQGTAGGLGIERVEREVEPVSWTERWDQRISDTSLKVESIAEAIAARGLLAA
jgi:hypothetical protein